MEDGDSLRRAREAFSRRDWRGARDAFLEARAMAPLAAEDVYLLGDAVWWLGEFRRALELYEEAYSLYLEEGLPRRAAMSAFGIAALAFMSGDEAFASGWLSRAMRLLETQPPSAEHGYLLFMKQRRPWRRATSHLRRKRRGSCKKQAVHFATPTWWRSACSQKAWR